MIGHLVEETDYAEEWYQPELECLDCGCTFMYASSSKFPEYPTYCPNCGIKFAGIKQGNCITFKLNKGEAHDNFNNIQRH